MDTDTIAAAARCFELLLALTRAEHAARADDDTLHADRCYHLRQSLLETCAQTGLDAIPAALPRVSHMTDPCDLAEQLLAILRAT